MHREKIPIYTSGEIFILNTDQHAEWPVATEVQRQIIFYQSIQSIYVIFKSICQFLRQKREKSIRFIIMLHLSLRYIKLLYAAKSRYDQLMIDPVLVMEPE